MKPKPTAEFKLSITKALADQLAEALEPLAPALLTSENLGEVEGRPGVYLLFLDGERVYVGKTADKLPARLRQHLRKISGRSGLPLERLCFTCVYVDKDMDSVAPERMLIAKYSSLGGVPWNNNGFGNKDPGRERDNSVIKINHFDAAYPINLETGVELPERRISVAEALDALKASLPFVLRFDKRAAARTVMRDHDVLVPSTARSFRDAIEAVLGALPSGWQATALPGYAILYPETVDYQSAIGWWRTFGDGGVEWRDGPSRRDPRPAEIPADPEVDDAS